MSSVREQNEALNKAVTGVAINLVKRVPIVGDLVSGIECYKNHIEKVQQERFIYSLADQLDEKSPKIQDNDGRVYDSIKDEQYLNFIAEKTKREKDFIRLCVSELDSLGFLSNQKIYGGERSGINSSARKFIKFVQSPAGTDN